VTKVRIKKAIDKIISDNDSESNLFKEDISSLDLGFKVFKLSPSNFKIWRSNEITEENLAEQLDAFTNPVKEESKTDNMLFELMLKAGYLLTDKVEVKEKFYSINDGELIIALEEMNEKIISKIISAQPKKVITLDNLFTGNDQLKTNTVLQMHDEGVDFKTI
jgi:adenine-specific DNA-methyltransferase